VPSATPPGRIEPLAGPALPHHEGRRRHARRPGDGDPRCRVPPRTPVGLGVPRRVPAARAAPGALGPVPRRRQAPPAGAEGRLEHRGRAPDPAGRRGAHRRGRAARRAAGGLDARRRSCAPTRGTSATATGSGFSRTTCARSTRRGCRPTSSPATPGTSLATPVTACRRAAWSRCPAAAPRSPRGGRPRCPDPPAVRARRRGTTYHLDPGSAAAFGPVPVLALSWQDAENLATAGDKPGPST